jgi:hypothetical protein
MCFNHKNYGESLMTDQWSPFTWELSLRRVHYAEPGYISSIFDTNCGSSWRSVTNSRDSTFSGRWHCPDAITWPRWVPKNSNEEQKAGVEGASRECLRRKAKTVAEGKITEIKRLGLRKEKVLDLTEKYLMKELNRRSLAKLVDHHCGDSLCKKNTTISTRMWLGNSVL